ncbi:YcxB family protein [Blastopirellula marina]|uniref:YcxB-like C-terminal domain-containing protein n=1 Tax=Blastopirellula marina DSM 3645 TaxID=314230 RepID=A3ZSP6_9BACT|nr:YcxB family protein [Blastopirellula marina]EAQ80318.1 hypothetical protein DSM3645_10752 [Blastopirellula marina DSM 3645]
MDKVEFVQRPEDAWAIPSSRTPAQMKRAVWLVIIAGALTGIIGVIPAYVIGRPLLASTILILFGLILFKASRQLWNQVLLLRGESRLVRLRLTPNFVESSTDNGRERVAWAGIDGVTDTGDFLLIVQDEHRAYVIPRGAFASVGEMCQFAALAQQYREAAIRSPSHEIGLDDDRYFAKWTSVAGPSVTYQNMRADLAYVWEYGVDAKPRDSDWVRFQQLFSCLGLSMMLGLLIPNVLFLFPEFLRNGILVFALIFSAIFWYAGSIPLMCMAFEFKKRSMVQEKWLMQQTVTISPAGAIVHTPTLILCRSWKTYDRIIHGPTLICFPTDVGGADFLIPKSAFPSTEQAEHFAAEAVRWHEAAGKLPNENFPSNEMMEAELCDD